jgi:alpha-aminoadipate carrier protein LysW
MEGKEAAMPGCPECETDLNVDVDEVEEGDVIACEECGTEYEVVGVEPSKRMKIPSKRMRRSKDEPCKLARCDCVRSFGVGRNPFKVGMRCIGAGRMGPKHG